MKLPKLSRTQWLICFVAALGFAFDIYELLMLPLIVRPALLELADVRPGTPEFNLWGRLCCSSSRPYFGGIFGLLGGRLTDRLGRRSVLVWSILLYGFSAAAAGFATSPEAIAVLPLHNFCWRLGGVRGLLSPGWPNSSRNPRNARPCLAGRRLSVRLAA